MTDSNMDTATPEDTVHAVVIPTNATTSTITNINLYTDRAQITRSYKFRLASGTTKLVIEGLPSVLDRESIRVEGRGNAMIQGVSAFKTPLDDIPEPSSALLDDLKDTKAIAQAALARYRKAVSTIDNYMNTMDIQHLDISKLGEAMDVYDNTEEKWETKIRVVQAEVVRIDAQIGEEKERLSQGESKAMKKLRTKVEVGLFRADVGEEEIEMVLVYAVSNASWNAGYDIRVDMETLNAPVKVLYKASINQRTGEAWTDVPITLETAQPTFGFEVPTLAPWTISLRDPASTVFRRARTKQTARKLTGGKAPRKQLVLREESALDDSDEDEDEEYDMHVDVAAVTSKGKVNATFRVPGLVSVPSDEEEHGVVIASLELDARVVWGCVPKGGKQVFLEANITNSSEYTFLAGPGNVYVDRSFISRSDIPGVSPKEEFKVALGVDPSIRVTYHPREKTVANSGFYNKTLRHTFTQRISIHNSKSIAIEGLRVTDQIPVSQDATNLNVILISPALTLPDPETAKTKANMPTVKESDGVIAMWNGTNEIGQGKDIGAIGKDGKIDWVCSLPAFGRVNLVLKWEVVASAKEAIYGL